MSAGAITRRRLLHLAAGAGTILASPRLARAAFPERPLRIMVGFASGGVGSAPHLAAELFARRAGVGLLHVPFRGGVPAVQSLLAGDVNLLWDTPQPATRAYIDEGRLRALCVMADKRLSAYSDIPA